MTITQENFALITELRTMTLKKGNNTVVIDNLPSQLDPTSVNFFFPDASIKLKEYHFAFDLEDTQTMLEKSKWKSIRVLHPELGTVQGKLISVHAGMLVIQTADGELRIITNYGGTQFVIEKSESQDELVTEPTLFCSVTSSSNVNKKSEFSYLTSGLNWQAEYTAIIDDDEKNVFFSPRAVISNYSGKVYEECKLMLLAGDIHREQRKWSSVTASRAQSMDILAKSAIESDFEESVGFEYHTFNLERTITLDNQQQKILPLYPTFKTAMSKQYTYHYQKDPSGVSVVISALNSKDKGLGYPLPAGTVRIHKRDGDQLLILGEDNIVHTPVGEEIKLKIGQAFDIMAERKVLDRKREGKNNEKMKISIEFRNRKNEDITIRVTEPITRRYDYRVLSSNIEVYKKEAKQIEFMVPVKANKTNTLEYEILYTW
jgi:hypothetical protein